ncbi:hypothetical protein K432DRAFT_89385 [Lepidopterella palustris CBS 459.81]|uniref:Uncharacterized protein n=1 Tax=Lepidopterella palustris CBS 459.81 TaxID=1314670 RepID=A0A8E2E721_9PEZI|nr:hypothetical protein K432DRAFT_89385 [Lepidopterella palustris CBS 459.81]
MQQNIGECVSVPCVLHSVHLIESMRRVKLQPAGNCAGLTANLPDSTAYAGISGIAMVYSQFATPNIMYIRLNIFRGI